mmetsp:Transcript_78639/g.138665  ORF Transcript_78639/g.138665 Transcript_78639/m.138665 type:complete len:979 (-) Transcript_78639:51-2987(-)
MPILLGFCVAFGLVRPILPASFDESDEPLPLPDASIDTFNSQRSASRLIRTQLGRAAADSSFDVDAFGHVQLASNAPETPPPKAILSARRSAMGTQEASPASLIAEAEQDAAHSNSETARFQESHRGHSDIFMSGRPTGLSVEGELPFRPFDEPGSVESLQRKEDQVKEPEQSKRQEQEAEEAAEEEEREKHQREAVLQEDIFLQKQQLLQQQMQSQLQAQLGINQQEQQPPPAAPQAAASAESQSLEEPRDPQQETQEQLQMQLQQQRQLLASLPREETINQHSMQPDSVPPRGSVAVLPGAAVEAEPESSIQQESGDDDEKEESAPTVVTAAPAAKTTNPANSNIGNRVIFGAGQPMAPIASIVDASVRFAKEAITLERAKYCQNLPQDVNISVTSAKTKIAQSISVVFDATLKTSGVPIPGQLQSTQVKGLEVQWMTSSDMQTSDDIAVMLNSQTLQVSAAAKLVMAWQACSLMKASSQAQSSLEQGLAEDMSLDEMEEIAASRLREVFLTTVGQGIVIDREIEEYKMGLQNQAQARAEAAMLVSQGPKTLPASWSWKKEKPECLDYVHQQGTCGACFMFSAVDSITDRHCINLGQASTLGHMNHLSVQQPLLCEPQGRQCSGGWAAIGFNHTQHVGLTTWADWPWSRECLSDSVCSFGAHCMSRKTYDCAGFFSSEQLAKIETFPDAMHVTKTEKCTSLLVQDEDACKAWADTAFGGRDHMLFLPGSPFCENVERSFSAFLISESPDDRWSKVMTETALLEQSAKVATRNIFKDFGAWLKRLFGKEDTDKQVAQAEDRRRRTAAASATTTVDSCDRNRCFTAPTTHKLTTYHYVLNTKDEFKKEIYIDGPIYTSFYVYEDFIWFFTHYPEDAYNFQWGANEGGHATVLIGWESSCTYHGDKTAIMHPQQHSAKEAEGTARRRTSTAECWHLRNTWGDTWGDAGYFRIVDDMLTGPEGANIHISSAAGDGMTSKS